MSSESELRRRELLRETRRLNQNQAPFLPAVHPRYQRIYRGLYPEGITEGRGTELHSSEREKEESGTGSSFTTRILVSALLFVGYIFICQSPGLVKNLDGGQVVELVQEKIQVEELTGVSGIEGLVRNFIK